MQAVIFNIQKFSLHDGPGIRTTVFMKGCPLRCKWCANPESQRSEVQVLYKKEHCVGCRQCIQACAKQALSMDGQQHIQVDANRCDGCLECLKACRHQALSHEGDWYTPQQALEVCLQDRDFYEESGGGVTISGGEGMAHPDFCEALVGLLKREGIHTAIETTGCVHPDVFKRLAPLFDLLLFDVKQADGAKHREGTGLDNTIILKNLAWAARQGLNILPRIPVIPGFNDDLADADAAAKLLQKVGLKQVQLLPFHQMGERKYEFLNQTYAYQDVPALHEEELRPYQQIFIDYGIHCFF